MVTYYAHSLENQKQKDWQRLKDHLLETAALAEEFGGKFGVAALAHAAGLLHDIGKYSPEFQRRLRGDSIRVDHSTAGAQLAVQLYGQSAGNILAYVVAGHHAGLPDFGSPQNASSLAARLENRNLPDFSAFEIEMRSYLDKPLTRLPLTPSRRNPGFSFHLLIRMLYSCLVDADFLNTESFLNLEQHKLRGGYDSLGLIEKRLDEFMDAKLKNSSPSAVNRHRKAILDNCIKKANNAPGLFTLTVPTGGGKTLASLSFGVKHALRHGLDRIIYVIPYTTIIEQNAGVFREVAGRGNVLEHHSNFQFTAQEDDNWAQEFQGLKLSAENWDAPLVATTNVQFFESLFAHKSSRCRKLHNIARSVIVLDEAQMLPTEYLKPCLLALRELVVNYGCSVVLCTATQPAIAAYLPEGLEITELAPDPPRIYQDLKRVKVTDLGERSDEQLTGELSNYQQVLCIVNTRGHALKIHEKMKDSGAYHLSARMCPLHRSQKFKAIKQALSNDEPCRVISTQLVEAGVDLDFPVVYRSICGLDSLAQAAGRCNREGHLAYGMVYSFRPEKHGLPKGWLSKTAEVASMVMRGGQDPLDLEAVKKYFEMLYGIEGANLDKEDILHRVEERAKQLAFPFNEIADKFRIIDDNTVAIIIPYDDHCEKLIDSVRFRGVTSGLARQLQPYTVQVYSYEYAELMKYRLLTSVGGHYLVLNDMGMYSQVTGLLYTRDHILVNDVLIV